MARFTQIVCIVTLLLIGSSSANRKRRNPGRYSDDDVTYYAAGSDPIGEREAAREYQWEDPGYMSDWNQENWNAMGSRLNQPKCIDIPANMSLCRTIGYTQMRLPNLLDHDTIREVTQQAVSWVPLLGIHCHPDTKLFLCSLFSPVCLDRPIWPCRTLCQAVKEGCESRMMKYGFPWPDMLRCDKFPLQNDLCIGVQTDRKPDEKKCAACSHPTTYESIVDGYCDADFVVRAEVMQSVVSGRTLKLTTRRKMKKHKIGALTRRELRKPEFYIEQGDSCDCAALADTPPVVPSAGQPATAPTKAQYILMGSKNSDGQAVIKFLLKFDKRDRDQKRAFREMRKNKDICGKIKGMMEPEAALPAPGAQTPPGRTQPRPAPPGVSGGGKKRGRKNRKKKGQGQEAAKKGGRKGGRNRRRCESTDEECKRKRDRRKRRRDQKRKLRELRQMDARFLV